MANLNTDEKAKLSQLVGELGSEDNTQNIRQERNSMKIRDDILRIVALRKENAALIENDPQQFIDLCQVQCSFLHTNYTNIFNKAVKDELDLSIMTKFLIVLKMIEDGQVDQHEGSVMVGKILKELYLDSAVRAADKLDQKYEADKPQPVESKPISWKEYKTMTSQK